MATPTRAQNGHARRKVMAWLKAQELPCHICGQPIDYTITDPHDPRHFECDELLPVSLGGSATDKANVAAAHRFCNEWRGNHMSWSPEAAREALWAAVLTRQARMEAAGRQKMAHSRSW